MSVNTLSRSKALRTALTYGISAMVLALEPAAHAQLAQTEESAVYFLRYGKEIADGGTTASEAHDVLMARARVGDRSLLIYDRQNGAVTVERGGRTRVTPEINRTGPETSFAYDYAGQHVRGTGKMPSDFDTYIRPLLSYSPALGTDANWSIPTSLTAIGVADASDTPIAITINRTYFRSNEKDVVLVEFDVPAFEYVTGGETVVQWGRGFAVTDPGFGEIHILATQHRASVLSANGEFRPVSVRTTLHGIERDGDWRMTFDDQPAIRQAAARIMEAAGDMTHAIVAGQGGGDASVPVALAARLDQVAFSAAENSANSIAATLEASQPESAPPPATAQIDPVVAEQDINDLPADPASSYSWPGRELTPEQLADLEQRMREAGLPVGNDIRAPDFQGMAEALSGLQDAMRDSGYAPNSTSEELDILVAAMAAAQLDPVAAAQDINDLPADPDSSHSWPGGELTPEQLADLEQRMREAGLPTGNDIRAPDLQGMAEALSGLQDAMRDSGYAPNSTSEELDILVAAMAAAAQGPDASVTEILDHLEATRSGAFDGGFVPWLQSEGDPSDVTTPDWLIEEAAGDTEALRILEAGYRTLLERLERELNEARRDAERERQQPRTVETADLGDADQFFANNAFAYTSMVGIIPTDLSRWTDWLVTQNVRELERLALTAGYPNLASALADSQNILRQSQDEGYRQWALQAPSCNGPAGCGPSYLERWHMKTSIVALGDILADSRDIFSTAGFSDIGISGLNLSYLLRDNALEDGDIVRVRISQFGQSIYEGQISLTNIGNIFNLGLSRGVASLEIFAVNEGTASPNTAEISIDNVVRGQGTQGYSLRTGETATLRIEAGAAVSGPTGNGGG